MIHFAIIRKILISLVPLVLYYLLRKKIKKQEPKQKSRFSGFTEGNIVEGKIVNEKKHKH